MKKELKFKSEKRRVRLNRLRNVGSWMLKIAIVCAVAFVLVLFFGKRVSNIGDSMNPEIENGDIVLVNTLIYNAKNPSRGDVIVFKPQGDETMHSYMKRVIGLPGETVEIKDGEILINGEKIEEDYKTTKIDDPGIVEEPITLGGDEFFVLGDDRQNSEDSRMADIGNVKRTEIEGKVWFVISPKDHFGFVK